MPIGAPSGELLNVGSGSDSSIIAGVNKLSQTTPCSSCHGRMDPYGKAVEGFDSLGRIRNNYSNDEAINYTSHSEGDAITTVKDLGVHLATTKKEYINYCATKNLLSLATGKDLFNDGDLSENNAVGSCYSINFYKNYISSDQNIKLKDLIKKMLINGVNVISETSKVSKEL